MKRVVMVFVAAVVATFAVASGETTTMKYDLGAENAKWKFVAGQWMRRPSGDRNVLAQTIETQPWVVAVLEDKKFADLDVSVRFRPVSGREDANGGIIFRAKDGQNSLLVRANALEKNFRLYTMRERQAEHDRVREGHRADARCLACDSCRRHRLEDPGLSQRHDAARSRGHDVHRCVGRTVD